jgi:hypothetical protein
MLFKHTARVNSYQPYLHGWREGALLLRQIPSAFGTCAGGFVSVIVSFGETAKKGDVNG